MQNQPVAKRIKEIFPGLTMRDVKSITQTIPGITKISPEIILNTNVIRNGVRRSAKLVGVEPEYFDIFNFELYDGKNFSDEQLKIGAPVCVVGSAIKTKFFQPKIL